MKLSLLDRIKKLFAPTFATPKPRIYRGDGTWCFYCQQAGIDIELVDRSGSTALSATWYGGRNDLHDSGRSASGVHTKNHPALLACALPMDLHRAQNNPCKGSPIPFLPWGTIPRSDGTYTLGAHYTYVLVRNVRNGKSLRLPLNDLGPAKSASNAIDLTQAAYRQLAGTLDEDLFVTAVIIRGYELFTRYEHEHRRLH